MKYEIGDRICIIGFSSSGKSTLAENIGKKKNIQYFHLDQLAHIPNTNWQRNDIKEFQKAHDEAIAGDKWVIDGCYSKLMPQRFARADTLIFIKMSRFGCLYRFIKRAFRKDTHRSGMLEGGIETLNTNMIKYILFKAPKKLKSYDEVIKSNPHLNVIYLKSFKEIDKLLEDI